jgi:hypothetical protein
MLKDL